MRAPLLFCTILTLSPFFASAQLNLEALTQQRTGISYKAEEPCIGQMGVAKMQALEVKLQLVTNNLQTKCLMEGEDKAAAYAQRETLKLRTDPTVFELEKCNLEKADDYLARVNALYDAQKPVCN